MYESNNVIFVDKEDQCYDCRHHNTGCPVIEGLTMGYFLLDDDIAVTNCSFYKPREGAQKVIQISEFIQKD